MLTDPNAIDFDAIDENVPEKGEYQIHTAEGVKNIAKYPDAKFKILRDIDMGGAEWTPVENFTGTLNGQNFKIRNFTISKSDANGNMAFIGVNEGMSEERTIRKMPKEYAPPLFGTGRIANHIRLC